MRTSIMSGSSSRTAHDPTIAETAHPPGGAMTTPSARVYVVHEPLKRETDPVTRQTDWVRTRDVSIAREFGELCYVFPAGRLSQDPGYLVRTAREKLQDFTSDDYLLLMGDTAAIAIAAVVAAQQLEEGKTHLKLLLWDSRLGRYYPLRPEVWPSENAMEPVGLNG